MASYITRVAQDIKGMLAVITDANGNALFGTVRLWNNTAMQIKSRHYGGIAFPAALIELRGLGKSNNLTMGVSAYDLTIRIHILDATADAGEGSVVEGQYAEQDENFEVWRYRDSLIVALTGARPSHCGTLQKHSEQQDDSHNELYHYTIDFATEFIDVKGSLFDSDSTAYVVVTGTGTVVDAAYPPPEKIFTDTFSDEFE